MGKGARWFRRKPPSDIAQHVLALMADPSRWEKRMFCVRHLDSELVVHSDWSLAISVGGVRMPLKGRDQWAVSRAYTKLRFKVAEHKERLATERIRQALALPAAVPQPANPPASPPAAAETESLEQVEARVRQLRHAVRLAASPT